MALRQANKSLYTLALLSQVGLDLPPFIYTFPSHCIYLESEKGLVQISFRWEEHVSAG